MTFPACNRWQLQTLRSGFTLIELILALALASVLTVIIGTALSFYVGDMDTRDSEIQRVQLATAVMRMISEDLRATLSIQPFDDSVLRQFLATSGMEAIAAGTAAPSSMLFDDSDPLDTDGSIQDLALGNMFLQSPGLIGNQSQIMIDVSRVPRLEEYQWVLGDSAAGMSDLPSDIKTVSYFVQAPGTLGVSDPLQTISPTTAVSGSSGGLIRRQLDRQITKYALEMGNLTGLNITGDLLAPEVLALEFGYWDGFLWQPEWNSDFRRALPVAVQVRLTIGPPGTDPSSLNSEAIDATSSEIRTFQQIVRLPMGRIVDPSEMLQLDDGMSNLGF